MLKDVEVKEIIAGVSSLEEILEINLWMQEQHARDQSILPTRAVSMDVEEIRVTYYDWMRMTGELPVDSSSQVEIVDVTPALELEKEKSVVRRSSCLRSSAPGRARKKKGTRKRRVWTQDMIEGGTYYSD